MPEPFRILSRILCAGSKACKPQFRLQFRFRVKIAHSDSTDKAQISLHDVLPTRMVASIRMAGFASSPVLRSTT